MKGFTEKLSFARNVLCMPAVFQKLCRWLSNCPVVGDPAFDLTAALNGRATLDYSLGQLRVVGLLLTAY